MEARAETFFELLRSRRVTREFSDAPVSADDLRAIVEAGGAATSAGNRSLNRFLVVRDRRSIELVRTLSPGMLGRPTALVVVCTDLQRAEVEQLNLAADRSVHIDVGTAVMNMMLAAHALGLGSCPTTSFSTPGVSAVLDLPGHAIPEFILQLGHRAAAPPDGKPPAKRRRARPPLKEIVFWERYGRTGPPDG